MIEIRDLRDVPLPEAMEVLLDARATRQVAEVQEAVAILHIVENYHRDLPDSPMPGRGRLVELAAEGGPKLNEFVPLELSAALGVSQQSITILISDLLDLEYRHPLLWQQVREGRTPLWHARKIAARVSGVELGLNAALELDRRLTPQLPGLTLGRSLKLLEGLIAALDPRGAEERAETERRKRWIRIQPTADGVSWLDGKLNSADGRQLDGALNRFAAILGANGNSDDREARRSSAIGILSNPALALALLRQDELRRAAADAGEEHERETDSVSATENLSATAADTGANTPAPDPHDSEGVRGAGADEGNNLLSDGPTSDECPDLPASLLSELAAIDPQRLLPKSTLFVHVSDRAIRKGRGVARVEGVGPVPVKELQQLLKGTRVRVVPVFDPGGVTPVDSYEIPASMRRAVLLRQPTDVFPFGSQPSRGLDLDHTDPYRHGTGERGQTRLDNLGPLSRRPHRAKTHAGWVVKQVIPGCFLWRSPLGFAYLRTVDGLTFPLGRQGPRVARGTPEPVALSA